MSFMDQTLLSRRSATLLAAAWALSLAAWPSVCAAQQAPASALRISGPYVYENLDLYLVHGRDQLAGRKLVPLAQALARKQVVVRETGNVSQLTIENLSDQEVYVQAGEIVKGGRQDRVLSIDLILPPKSGQVGVASFCVERGRWQKRGTEAADHFASSEEQLAHKDLKMANHRGEQAGVWASVGRVQQKLASNLGGDVRSEQSASSLQLTLENDRVQKGIEGYLRAFVPLPSAHPDALGFVFAIDGVLNSAELYGSPALFRELWPKLIRATAVEAVAEGRRERAHTPPRLDAVRTFVGKVDEGTLTEKPATARTRTITRETASRVLTETQVRGRGDTWVHRSYLHK